MYLYRQVFSILVLGQKCSTVDYKCMVHEVRSHEGNIASGIKPTTDF